MKNSTIVAVLLALFLQSCADAQPKEVVFLGKWFLVDAAENVHADDFLEITIESKGIAASYSTGGTTFSGGMQYSQDGKSLEGILIGFGRVVLSLTESTSQFRNGAISMDQENEIEDISIGFFQKKEVLEQLEGRKLP